MSLFSRNALKSIKRCGLFAGAFALACCLGITGCAQKVELAEGVAAQVEEIVITEDQVTAFVQSYLASEGVVGEESLAAFLIEANYTSELLRSDAIGHFVDYALISIAAQEKGIELDTSQLNSYMYSVMGGFESEEAWLSYLDSISMTEDAYRDYIAAQLLEEKLVATFTVEDDFSDAEVLEAAQSYASYFDNAKKVAMITFAPGNEALAREVLSKIQGGQISFEDAARQYSTDAFAEQGGLVGWDILSYDAQLHAEQLAGMSAGEVSDLIISEDGIVIVSCEEVFSAPAELSSPDQLPEEFVVVIEQILGGAAQQAMYEEWMLELEESADIVYAEMPADLPYYVDLSQYAHLADEHSGLTKEEVEAGGQIAAQ